MNTNNMKKIVGQEIAQYAERVYKNKAKGKALFPYVVFNFENGVFNGITNYFLNVQIYEDSNVSSEVIEDIADSIQEGLHEYVYCDEDLKLHIQFETRQYISPDELVGEHVITLQFSVTTYENN